MTRSQAHPGDVRDLQRSGRLVVPAVPDPRAGVGTMNWIGYALIGAFAAGATAVLAKLGLAGIPSNLAMAIRTTVVLVLAWCLVVARNEQAGMALLTARTWVFLALSGIAT